MTEVPEFSPGCFGSALAFREDIPACLSCNFRAQCQPIHVASLAKLREHYGIVVKPKLLRRKTVVTTTDEKLLTLPRSVRLMIERIDRSSIRITESLAKGLNPFEEGFPFLKIACHLLLRLNRPIDRPLLVAAFVKKMSWPEATAESYARLTIYVLTYVGAVDLMDGRITLRKPNV